MIVGSKIPDCGGCRAGCVLNDGGRAITIGDGLAVGTGLRGFRNGIGWSINTGGGSIDGNPSGCSVATGSVVVGFTGSITEGESKVVGSSVGLCSGISVVGSSVTAGLDGVGCGLSVEIGMSCAVVVGLGVVGSILESCGCFERHECYVYVLTTTKER